MLPNWGYALKSNIKRESSDNWQTFFEPFRDLESLILYSEKGFKLTPNYYVLSVTLDDINLVVRYCWFFYIFISKLKIQLCNFVSLLYHC